MVREGNYDDVAHIVRMASEFWKSTIYDDDFCGDSVASMAELCIDQGLMSVLEVSGEIVGFACGVKGALLGNSRIASGTEIAWWVDEKHRAGRNGIALLRHIESLAKKAGIKYWNMAFMVSSMPEQIESIYKKMGYEKTEVIYSRVL